jgi:hypothetical protein
MFRRTVDRQLEFVLMADAQFRLPPAFVGARLAEPVLHGVLREMRSEHFEVVRESTAAGSPDAPADELMNRPSPSISGCAASSTRRLTIPNSSKETKLA